MREKVTIRNQDLTVGRWLLDVKIPTVSPANTADSYKGGGARLDSL